ncbi:hypothetical protein PIB30_007450 [Stylosanthes scabra]|uniref:Uncharacterized protein n=1 Tax=Stylosanthes scabra TaxID=79078 RepID=A0ABU6R3H5_9FABA|nr:hypothetical protein [Stylosanthes scabra]
MVRWSDLHDKGITKNLFEISAMNINGFHQFSKPVQLKEMHMLRHVKELLRIGPIRPNSELSTTGCHSLDEVFESRGGMVTKERYDQNINHYELRSDKSRPRRR